MNRRGQSQQIIPVSFWRREPVGAVQTLKAGFGAFVGIAVLGGLLEPTGLPLLIAPFGASAILVFGYPHAAFAQPLSVLGSYSIAAAVGFLAMSQCPGTVWATALAVAFSLVVMMSLGITHPPAGAIPLIAYADSSHLLQLIQVAIVGATVLIALAFVLQRLPPRGRHLISRNADKPSPNDHVSSND
ncbi:HPP family protein [Bradyrhizobium genosp. P]|uniref:HPP family protein n=1 Tax=Bradyrhizobium genosp. P TaxID=83641 RepID=UPI003CF50CF8